MKKLTGLIALLCVSLALKASPFTEQQTQQLEYDIQLLNDSAVGVNDLQFSEYFLQNLRHKHRILSQYFADPDVNNEDKNETQALYQSLNHTLSLYINDLKPLDFSEQNNQRDTPQGVITGRIYDAHNQFPIENSNVKLYNGNGGYKGSIQTDNLGRYVFTQLVADDYYVRSGGNNYYVDQFNGDIICPGGIGQGCELSDLIPIVVSANGIVENIDIHLSKSGNINGTMTFEGSWDSRGIVELYDNHGTLLKTQYPNYSGNHYNFYIPPNNTENLYLKFSADNHFSKLYDNLSCDTGCIVTNGTPINVSPNQTLDLGDTELQALSGLSGTIQVNETVPLNSTRSSIYITDTNNTVITTVLSGFYVNDWSLDSLPSGDYYAYTQKDGYIPQFYNLKNCDGQTLNDCPGINPTTIHHDEVNETNQIDFNLDQYGSISGLITNQLGIPLNASIRAYNLNGEQIAYDSTYGGNYTLSGLPDGQYYIIAQNSGYLKTMYPDFICLNGTNLFNCDGSPPASSIITISQQNHLKNINITLFKGASIKGQVKNENLQFINSTGVVLMDSQYNIIKETQNSRIGYTFNGLTTGDYYLAARESDQYKAALYDNITCETFSECTFPLATKIAVGSFTEYGPFDIIVTQKPILSINLQSNKPNTQVNSGYVTLYNSQGHVVDEKSASSSNVLFYPPAGQYYAVYQTTMSSYSQERFISKPFGGSNCHNNCSPLSGSSITVSNQGITERTITLDAKFKIYGQLSLSESNLNYPRIGLRIYRNNQLTDTPNYNDSHLNFFTGAESIKIAAEFPYFYSNFYNGIICQGENCGLNQAKPINPTVNGELNIDFVLQPINSISGQVLDPQNQPISNFTVSLISEYGTSRTASTDVNGSYSFNGLNENDYNIFTQSQSHYLATRDTGNICEYMCPFDASAAISLGTTNHITNVNISPVKKGGIVVNNLRYISNKIANNIAIEIYDRDTGAKRATYNTDSLGNTGEMYLNSGNYYLIAAPYNSPAPHTAYPSFNCRELSETVCRQSATTITVTGTNIISLNDFIIHDAGQLSVALKDVNSQAIINESRIVNVYDSNLSRFKNVSTQNGVVSDVYLPSGEYFLMAEPRKASRYSAGLYPDIDCPKGIGIDCVVSQGQAITVNDNQVLDIEILLNEKPSINIQAYDAYSGNKIISQINVYDAMGYGYLETGNNNLHKLYLDSDNYYILVKPASNTTYNYNSKLYPDVICEEYNMWSECDYLSAQLVSINPTNNPLISVDLDLTSGFKGQVINGLTNLPIENATIDFWRDWGSNTPHEHAVFTNAEGKFSLPKSGTFYITTHIPNGMSVFNEVYNNRHCFDGSPYWGLCNIKQGDLISNNSNKVQELIFILDGDAIFDNSFESITP